MSRENSKLSSLSIPRSQPQHSSRNHGSGDDDDSNAYAISYPARNQLSLDLDVKRVRPIIEKYESTRPNLTSSKETKISPPAEAIVPSLGLHMLQTVSPSGNEGFFEHQATIQCNVSRPTQKQPSGDYVQSESSSENVGIKEGRTNQSLQLEEESEEQTHTNSRIGKANASNKIVKGLIIFVLLLLQLLLVYSMYTHSSSDRAEVIWHIQSPLVGEAIKVFASLGQYVVSSLASVVDSQKKSFPLDHLEKRLYLGQSLLSELNDPAGAHAACSSVTSVVIHHFHDNGNILDANDIGSLTSFIFSRLPYLNDEENRLLADALLCIGEAKLALLQPSKASPLTLRNVEAKKMEIIHAKEAFEASISVDPTNPASRAGLGLTFLLLGTLTDSSDSGTESDEMVQYLIQSIQHLTVAAGWSAESTVQRIATINLAATHNLGLAYLALDSIRSSTESQFLEMVSSLQTPEHPHRIIESSVLLANKGAVLLQMGKVEEAMLSLESTALSLSCGIEEPLELDRIPAAMQIHQREACLILQQNIDVTRGVVLGEQRQGEGSDDMTTRWSSFNMSAGERTQSELLQDDAGPTSDSVSITKIDEIGMPSLQTQNKTSTDAENSEPSDTFETTSDDIMEFQTHDRDQAQLPTEDYSFSSTESLSGLTWGVKTTVARFTKQSNPKLQNALVALEQAAEGGSQRPRLLLALAKVRSSTGDLSGAIDATLNAISFATSAEETDLLTSYLETLMSKLTWDGSDDALDIHTKQSSLNDVSEIDYNKDRTISELEMKLEIEKLKYRVLEQEHKLQYHETRLSGDQNPRGYGAIDHVLDYKHERNQIRSEPTLSEIGREEEEPVDHASAEQISGAHLVDTEQQQLVDTEQQQLVDTSAENSLEVDSGEINISSQSISSESTSTERIATSVEDFAYQFVRTNSNEIEAEVNQTAPEVETDDHQENHTHVEPVLLPSLFNPPLKPPVEISATAKSYMKIADAYLDKGKYSLASKQFLKVIRKAPDHLAAHLGYATALERAGKNRQLNDAAAAYGNATRIAIIQGDKIDPLVKAGAGGMAESILRRAVKIAQSASNGRLELLQSLSNYAHTLALAADLYHAIGMELTKQNMAQESNRKDALKAFSIANEFMIMRNDSEVPLHLPSILEMGNIALENEGNPVKAIEYFEKAKRLHLDDDNHVRLLVLAGRAHSAVGAIDTAIADLTRALSFSQCASTASAHHELAIALGKNNADKHEINFHFEKALDLGLDPTDEAIASLGEHNMSIMRSFHRLQWRQFNDGDKGNTGGGIMSGGGVGSQKSVFAPQAEKQEEPSAQTETLALLEQGAATYDGHVPMGGEIEGGTESKLSNLSGRKRT